MHGVSLFWIFGAPGRAAVTEGAIRGHPSTGVPAGAIRSKSQSRYVFASPAIEKCAESTFPLDNLLSADYNIKGKYNGVIWRADAIDGNTTTLERIHQAAKAEFLEKSYKDASLRRIVKSVGMTTGAFYGYYKSKEELFEALAGKHYEYILTRFRKAQQEFARLPHERQPDAMGEISETCMLDMLHYAYAHLEECKLILCCSKGTKFSGLIDELVEIETEATHAYQQVLQALGRPSPKIDPALEHILITGMFHTFFELIVHEMPPDDAENYVKEMRAFYTAGWMKIMGQ